METSRQKKFAKELKELISSLRIIKKNFLQPHNSIGNKSITIDFLNDLSTYLKEICESFSEQIKIKLEYDEKSRDAGLNIINKSSLGKKKSESRPYLEKILDAAIDALKILDLKKAELNRITSKNVDNLSDEYEFIFYEIIEPLEPHIYELKEAFEKAFKAKVKSPFAVLKSQNVKKELSNNANELKKFWDKTMFYYNIYLQFQKTIEDQKEEVEQLFWETIDSYMSLYDVPQEKESLFLKLDVFNGYLNKKLEFTNLCYNSTNLSEMERNVRENPKRSLKYISNLKTKLNKYFSNQQSNIRDAARKTIEHISGLKEISPLEKTMEIFKKEHICVYTLGIPDEIKKLNELYKKFNENYKQQKIIEGAQKLVAKLINDRNDLDDLLKSGLFK